jgi:hypothetical protein
MDGPRTVPVVLLAVALATAGCVGADTGTPTATSGTETPGVDAPTTATGTETPATPGTPTTATATETPATAGTGTPTVTPLPGGSVDVPDGPMEPPGRPAVLNDSAVGEYVRAVEYSVAYNSLWLNEYTDVTLACRVDAVSERPWGYEAVVTCTGYSDTDVPENATATPGPHADWFTQSFRYRVGEDATHRGGVDPREPVS